MLAMMSPFAPLRMHMTMADELCQPMRMTVADALLNTHPAACARPCTSPSIVEREDKFEITIECAGVNANDIELEAHGSVLTVKGLTKTAINYHIVNHRVALPERADFSSEHIAAECVDGILLVTVPKRPVPAPLSIAVETTTGEDAGEEAAEKDKYSLTVVAAGIAAAELALKVDERGLLTVSGESKRTGARLAWSCRLPRDADAERASAVHVDGILTVSVPKKEEEAPSSRKIRLTKAAAADEAEAEAEAAHAPMDAEADDAVMV